jgi:citrate lyase subunit beta/citryl-CoA lyase/(S)-citramalyl-CoA lyase
MAVSPPLKLAALLFTPGNRPERFAKAATSGADGIIIDLEDSVGVADKERVRLEVVAWLQKNVRVGTPPFLTGLRLNSLRSPAGRADLEAIRAAGLKPDFVMLSKVESAAEAQLGAAKLPASVRLICLTETVRGVRFADEIAAASPRVVALAFGGLDLSAETGGEPVWEALLWPRTQVVHACAAAGIVALDQPYIDFNDAAGLEQECTRARTLGYTGKLAIHPRQCATIATAFRPTEAQIERARRIVAAYDGAGGNVAVVDGQMIDVPIYRSAQRVLQRAGA